MQKLQLVCNIPLTSRVYCCLLIKHIALHMAHKPQHPFHQQHPLPNTLSSSFGTPRLEIFLPPLDTHVLMGWRERYDRSHLATQQRCISQLLNEYALSLNVLCDTDRGIIPPWFSRATGIPCADKSGRACFCFRNFGVIRTVPSKCGFMGM